MEEQQRALIRELIKVDRDLGDLLHEKAFIMGQMVKEEGNEKEQGLRLFQILQEMSELTKKGKEVSARGLDLALKNMGIKIPPPPPVPVNTDPDLS